MAADRPPTPREDLSLVGFGIVSYGDCTSCDGYILNPADGNLCPTCARLKREAVAREQDGI